MADRANAGAAWSATTAWPGWHEFPPSCPPTLEEADPAAYDAKARLAHMDANGIYAQVLYPNVIAFEGLRLHGPATTRS